MTAWASLPLNISDSQSKRAEPPEPSIVIAVARAIVAVAAVDHGLTAEGHPLVEARVVIFRLTP